MGYVLLLLSELSEPGIDAGLLHGVDILIWFLEETPRCGIVSLESWRCRGGRRDAHLNPCSRTSPFAPEAMFGIHSIKDEANLQGITSYCHWNEENINTYDRFG